MYRRPKFLEILLEIRRDMALEADYDVDLFVQTARNGPVSVNDTTDSGSQTIAEPSNIDAEILTVSGTRREIRKR
jgi:hypothetical protein